ncbi:MAG: hypothetical protein WCO66_03075 [Candidatus Absconditabacteria bacterium]
MTSISVAYNKKGIAIAADSAATTQSNDGKYKIFNANKIFRLSEDNVGIGIYQADEIGNIPREIIIDSYRKTLKKKFKKLEEYVYDFIDYVQTSSYIENIKIEDLMLTYLGLLEKDTTDFITEKKTEEKGQLTDEIIANYLSEYFSSKFSPLLDSIETNGQLPSYLAKDKGKHLPKCGKINIDEEIVKNTFRDLITKNNPSHPLLSYFDSIFRGFLVHLSYTDIMNSFTGLVFVGYGNEEYFPQSFHLITKFKYSGTLYLTLLKDEDTKKNGYGGVEGYADSETIQSSVLGYNNNLKALIFKGADDCVSKICEKIKTDYNIDVVSDNVSFIKSDIEAIINDYGRDQVQSFFGAVRNLSIDELGNVVETLVNMSSFKKRISQEVETVGGMTDVAVISKGDGFIWLKKKRYFDKNDNHHFKC